MVVEIEPFGLVTFEEDKQANERRAAVDALSSRRHVYHVVQFEGEDAYDLDPDAAPELLAAAAKARKVEDDPAMANIFSSALRETWDNPDVPMDERLHTVALDIDFPVRAIPSTNPEHSHLYIDKVLTWADYKKLIRVMVEVGLVEEGYGGVSERRGATHLRMPWEKKS